MDKHAMNIFTEKYVYKQKLFAHTKQYKIGIHMNI